MGDTRPAAWSARDAFAAAALTGLVQTITTANMGETLARQAYALADAMLQVKKTTDTPDEPPPEVLPEGTKHK